MRLQQARLIWFIKSCSTQAPVSTAPAFVGPVSCWLCAGFDVESAAVGDDQVEAGAKAARGPEPASTKYKAKLDASKVGRVGFPFSVMQSPCSMPRSPGDAADVNVEQTPGSYLMYAFADPWMRCCCVSGAALHNACTCAYTASRPTLGTAWGTHGAA